MLLADIIQNMARPSYKSGIVVKREGNNDFVTFKAFVEEAEVGKLSINGSMIVELDSDDSGQEGIVSSALLRSTCMFYDYKGLQLSCIPNDLPIKRFLERFGFHLAEGEVMQRHVGAKLPPEVVG